MKNTVDKTNKGKIEKDFIQIRIDKNLKKTTKETLDKMGLDFTTAINLFFRKVNIEQAIPFQIAVDNSFNSETNKEFLLDSIKQAKDNKVVVKTIDELEEMENE